MRLGGLVTSLRRPPVLASGSLLLVSAAIVANALFLQSRQHPAPLVTTRRAAEESPVRRSDDLVLAVQSALRRVGYYSGPLDGLAGPQTDAAIRAFEKSTGRPETGAASLELLADLKEARAGDASSLTSLAAEPEAAPEPDPRIAAIQHALAIAAYGPVREDGFLGPQTHEAIKRFQQDHGLPITGEISDALVVELRSAGALQEF